MRRSLLTNLPKRLAVADVAVLVGERFIVLVFAFCKPLFSLFSVFFEEIMTTLSDPTSGGVLQRFCLQFDTLDATLHQTL